MMFQFLPIDFQCLKCRKNLEYANLNSQEEENPTIICKCWEKRVITDFLVRAKKFGLLNPWIKWEMKQYNIQPSEEKRNDANAGIAY